MRSGKAVRLDDEAYAKLMQVKGLIEARDSREYSASDLVAVLVDEMYAACPAMAEALRLLTSREEAKS